MDENEVIFTFLQSHTERCAAAEIEHASVFLPKRGRKEILRFNKNIHRRLVLIS